MTRDWPRGALQLSGQGHRRGTEPEPVFGVASAMTLAGPAASDNFNRADGGLGVNWAKPVPASEQTLVIVSNQVTPISRTGTVTHIGSGARSVKISIPRCRSAVWGRGTG